MKCIKCGFEYEEGRSCPKCGEPSIIINKDYYRRRQKWEKKNSPKEELSDKNDKKIVISRGMVIKIITGIFVISIILFLIHIIVFQISEYIRVNRFEIVMDINDNEDMLYTCDGVFACKMPALFSGFTQDFMQRYCSYDGKSAAGVVFDENSEKYNLYISLSGESRLLYESIEAIQILRVNCDGSVLFRNIEYGEYNAVLNTQLIEADNTGNVKILSEENCYIVETGLDKVYCFISPDGNVYEYSDNRIKTLCYGIEYSSAAYAVDKFYYTSNGKLYDSDGSLIDESIEEKSLKTIFGTEELLYIKDSSVYILDSNLKKYVFSGESENISADDIIKAVRKGSNIYVMLADNIIKFDLSEKKFTKLKENFNFFLKNK